MNRPYRRTTEQAWHGWGDDASTPRAHAPTDSTPESPRKYRGSPTWLPVPRLDPTRCALDVFSAIIRLGFRTNNLWMSRDTELDQIERDAGSLPYLASDRKSEVRDWDEIEFIPFELFARLRGVS